jgi:hypothetical protein
MDRRFTIWIREAGIHSSGRGLRGGIGGEQGCLGGRNGWKVGLEMGREVRTADED